MASAVERLEERRFLSASPAAGLAPMFNFGPAATTDHAVKVVHRATSHVRPKALAFNLTLQITGQQPSGMFQGNLFSSVLGNFAVNGAERKHVITMSLQGAHSGTAKGRISANGRRIEGTFAETGGGTTTTGTFTLTQSGANGSLSSTSRSTSTGLNIPVPTPPTIIGGSAGDNGSSNALSSTSTNSQSSTNATNTTNGTTGLATGGLGFASTLSGSGVARGLPGIGGGVTGVQGGTNGVDTSVTGTNTGVTGLASGTNGTVTSVDGNAIGITSSTGTLVTNNTVVSSTTPPPTVNAPGTVPGLTTFPIPSAPVIIVGSIGTTSVA